MVEFFMVFIEYIKSKFIVIVSGIISLLILIAVLWLYELPLEPIIYAVLLIIFFLLILAVISFKNFYKRHKSLNILKNNIDMSNYTFPKSENLVDKDYQDIITKIKEVYMMLKV